MTTTINLEELKEYDLTPNQQVLLKAIKSNNLDLIFWDYSNDLEELKTKGYYPTEKIINSMKNFNFHNFVIEWMKLWPTHELPGGYRVSGNTMEVTKRMKKFLTAFNYSPDIIIQATKNYLEARRFQNWVYTKKNSKFIYDSDGSMLEQECQALTLGEVKPRDNAINM